MREEQVNGGTRLEYPFEALPPTPAAVHAGCDDAAGAKAYQDAMLKALCQGIVEEMQQNAEVLVKSVAGVTPGGGKSGPGTGTIT